MLTRLNLNLSSRTCAATSQTHWDYGESNFHQLTTRYKDKKLQSALLSSFVVIRRIWPIRKRWSRILPRNSFRLIWRPPKLKGLKMNSKTLKDNSEAPKTGSKLSNWSVRKTLRNWLLKRICPYKIIKSSNRRTTNWCMSLKRRRLSAKSSKIPSRNQQRKLS